MNLYIAITTIKKYKIALDILLESLPKEWKNKYILVYENENSNDYKVFDDGHIEVTIQNNIYDYGNWVGINMLITNKVIYSDSWFLFIHDTCRFLSDSCVKKTNDIILEYHKTNVDIIWLSHNGQCNICLIRRDGIKEGERYKNIMNMTKEDTIIYEWTTHHILSPKSFNVIQNFLDIPTVLLGKRYVYNNEIQRDVLLYNSIDMEKYYYFIFVGVDTHPSIP